MATCPAPIEQTAAHSADLAIHLVEEHVQAPGMESSQVVYATNVYHKNANGW
ncbi:MAG: hypothetical protein ABFS39_06725 [Pseudomonadota bacterium]